MKNDTAAILEAMQAKLQNGMETIVRPGVQNRHRQIEFPATTTLLGRYKQLLVNPSAKGVLKQLEDPKLFEKQGFCRDDNFTSTQYSSREAYDNFAIRIVDTVSDKDLHEIISFLLQGEKERTSHVPDTFLRNNSLAKSFLQIQISRHSKDGLLSKILKNHFVTTLEMDAASKSITELGVSLGCPELANSFKGLNTVDDLDAERELSNEIRPVVLRPIEESKAATKPVAPTHASCCGVLSSAVTFCCKAFFGTLYAAVTAMSIECLTKSFGLTSSVADSLQALSLKPIAYLYDMRASTALHSAALSLTSKESEATRTAVSAAIVFGGACMLASMLYSRCKEDRSAERGVN